MSLADTVTIARQSCAVIDLSSRGHMAIRGKDHVRFLQGMLTNDVAKLAVGAACHALVLTQKGKVVGDLWIYKDADGIFCECLPGSCDTVSQALERFIVMDEVVITRVAPESIAELGVFGPRAAEFLEVTDLSRFSHRLLETDIRVASTPDTGLDEFRLFGPPQGLDLLKAKLLKKGAMALSPEAFDVLRIEGGRAWFGIDFDENSLPMQAPLEDALSFTKGCYIGQEVVVRGTTRGAVKHRIAGLVVDGDSVPPARAKIHTDLRPDAGQVTSAAFSPTLGRVIALAMMWREASEVGTRVVVELEGRTADAVVSPLPFIQNCPEERS